MKKLLLHYQSLRMLTGFILITATLNSLAQNTQYTVDLEDIVPSPNAASLGSYAASPPDLATGSISQSIPLTVVEGKSLQLPVSLNYSNNGLQTKEEASWAGFGWTLSAGGAITRQVKGLPDENYNNNHQLMELFPGVLDYWGINPGLTELVNQDYINFQDSVHSLMIDQKEFDPEPDVFHFNVPGASGKFIIYDDTAYTIPYENVRIDFTITTASGPSTSGSIDNFKITTADGTKYFFDEKETSYDITQSISPEPGHNSFPDYTSAWFLTKIESAAADDEITLSYSGNVEEIKQTHYSHVYTERNGTPISLGTGSYSYTSQYSKRLSSITSSKMRVDFLVDSTNARIDLETETIHGNDQARRLMRMEIYELNDELKYAWNFNHSYFGTFQDAEHARLKLDGLYKEGNQGEALPGYSFTYNHALNNVSKRDYAYDHWGYYNGAVNNPTAIPVELPTPNVGGADRDPNPAVADYFMLREISYPTGGYTVYDYEANLIPDPANPTVIQNRDSLVAFNGLDDPNGLPQLPSDEDTVVFFNINFDQTVTLNRSATVWSGWNASDFYYRVRIHHVGTTDSLVYHKLVTTLADIAGSATIALDSGSYKLSVYKTHDEVAAFADVGFRWDTGIINPGKFGPGMRLAKMTTTGGGNSDPLVYTYKYNLPSGFTSSQLVEEPLYQPVYVDDFPIGYETAYRDTLFVIDDNAELVAVQNSLNSALHPMRDTLEVGDTVITWPDKTICTYAATSNWNWDGNNVRTGGGDFRNKAYYTYVEEFRGNDDAQGKSVYQYKNTFTSIYDPVTGANAGPQVLGLGQEVLTIRPYLAIKQDYQNTGLTLRLVNEEQYSYEGNYLDKHIIAAKPEMFSDRRGCTFHTSSYPDYLYRFDSYYYNAGWVRPKQVINTFFDANGGSRTTTTTYSYDSKFHRQVTSEQTDYHNGEYQVNRYKYPEDYATGFPVSMANAHVVSPVIERQSWRHTSATDSTLTSGLITNYNPDYKPAIFYEIRDDAPITSLSAEGTNSEGKYLYAISDSRYIGEETRTYNAVTGRIKDRSPKSGVEEAYLWSADGNYLLAKVINATVDDVYYNSFDTPANADANAYAGTGSYTSATGFAIPFTPANPSDYVITYRIWANAQWEYRQIDYVASLSFNGKIDELRVLPKDAQMQTISYDAVGNVTEMVDVNNRRSRYAYDEHQRLIKVTDHNGHILKTYTYNQKN